MTDLLNDTRLLVNIFKTHEKTKRKDKIEMIREKPADSSEHAWREFCTYCSGHNIGNHYDLWSPWWDIWKIAYNFGKVHEGDTKQHVN